MFLLFNIGCIECGVPSAVVGVFDSRDIAEAHANRLNADGETAWRNGGQNSYEVFKLPAPGILAPEYRTNSGG